MLQSYPLSLCSTTGLTSCPASDTCSLPVDVIVQCSDGKQHGSHARNLGLYATGFLTSDDSESEHYGEVENISIEEDSNTFILLCKFLHHQAQPDVSSLPWKTFVRLSFAVEKYRVYTAMGICKLKMEYSVEDHPYDVFQYAAAANYEGLRDRALALCLNSHPLDCFVRANDHNLIELRDKASIKTLNIPIEDVVVALKGSYGWTLIFTAWVRQREQLRNGRLAVLKSPPSGSLHKGGLVRCDDWKDFYDAVCLDVYKQMDGDFKKVTDKYKHLLDGCTHCLRTVELWKRDFDHIITTLPSFSTFCDAPAHSPSSNRDVIIPIEEEHL